MSSPPLSTLHLAPGPRRPRLGRPSSVISSSSRSSLRSESSGPPPSAYDRRSKSLELLKGLKFLASTPEDQEDQDRSYVAEQRRPIGPLSALGRLASFKKSTGPLSSDWQVVELDEQSIHRSSSSSSHATITPRPPPIPPKMAQDPSPKKKGFFRRLSLSTSSHKAQVTPNGNAHLVKSSRTVSGGVRKDPVLAGPAYDTLPPGAAPSAYREVRQDGMRDPRKDTPPSQHLFPDHGPLPPHPAKSSSRPSNRQAPTPPVPIAPPQNARHTSPPPGSSSRYASPSHSQTPPARNTESPHTPRRTSARNPIHPALASPPKSPPQLPVGTSPYDVRSMGSSWKQSYSIPAGLSKVEANGLSNGVPPGASAPGKRSVSSPMTPPGGPSVSGLAEALPNLGTNTSGQTLPKSISNLSGRFADAETPSTERPSTSLQTPSTSRSPLTPGSASRKSAFKSPPVSMRTPKQSDTSVPTTSPYTPTQKSHSPTSPRNAPPPLPHTRTSYFPQSAQFDPNNPETPPVARRTSSATPGGVMSEASAYAMAMSSRSQKSPIERENTSSAPPAPERQRKSSRPLPRPPGERSPASQPHTTHIIASSDDKRQRTASGRSMSKAPPDVPAPQPVVVSQSAPVPNGHVALNSPERPRVSLDKPRPKVVIPESPPQNRRVSTKPYQFDFTHSPTLPPLVDPRQSGERQDPIDQWAPQQPSAPAPPPAKRTSVGPPVVGPPLGAQPSAMAPQPNGSPALESTQLPPRRTSILPQLGGLASTVGAIFSSPTSASPISPTAGRTRSISGLSKRTTHKHLLGRGGKPTLAFLLAHPTIQSGLLPYLTINSFLSLTGCSDLVRKQLSGELVGRWVLKEWGLQVDREKGRSWPNLTVWEGFLESLLHDPGTYSTYPPQWHGLLQHLSLSHTLIVLHLRNLPASAFPNTSVLPFEDEGSVMMTQMPFSQSTGSLSSTNLVLPRSRAPSRAGSDNGSITPSTRTGGPPPKSQERLVEIVMPEPLAAKPEEAIKDFEPPTPTKNKLSRKGSRTSIISTTSFGLGRRRANSVSAKEPVSPTSASTLAAPMPGKRELPPVSFPSAKRYTFTRHGDPPPNRTRTMSGSMSSRPGSIFSVASSPSGSYQQRMSIGPASHRASFAVDRGAPPVPSYTSPRSTSGLSVPNGPGVHSHRSSFASSDGRSRVSEFGGYSPQNPRFASPFLNRGEFTPTPPPRIEQAFERPPPYNVGRAPVLRVFVPLSEKVRKWPSAEGAAASVKELDKCGATRRLKLGDFVVNTALRHPKHTEHVLVFVPYIKHLLVPLEYKYSPTGHLPSYLDAFTLPPSYYYPFLPSPQIIFLNLAPYCIMAMGAIRLAFDRRDVTTASGARISAKRYLHVTGFQVNQGDPVAPEWMGMVSLESEGTAEGKIELERRLGGGDPNRAVMGPWEVIREKSMMGTIWLKLVKVEEQQRSPTVAR